MNRTKRPGFSMIEALVLIAITSVAVGLLMVAVQRSGGTANRIHCVNNLKQLGLACQVYADGNNSNLPTDDAKVTIWFTLLPFILRAAQNEAFSGQLLFASMLLQDGFPS